MRGFGLSFAVIFSIIGNESVAFASSGLGAVESHDFHTFHEFQVAAASIQEVLAERASKGDAQAMLELGELYLKSRDDPQQIKKAIALLTQASEAGNSWAALKLADLYQSGAVQPSNIELAMKFLKQAAGGDVPIAKVRLAEVLLRGDNVSLRRDREEILSLLKAANGSGEPWAALLLGDIFLHGKLVKSDANQAIGYYKLALSSKVGLAALRLGEMYLRGGVIKKDEKLALFYFQQASEEGIVEGKTAVGLAYLRGQGVSRNVRRAIALLDEASKGGDVWASVSLGDIYSFGADLPPDAEKAVAFYQRAADRQNPAAALRLGDMYFNGELVKTDRLRAVHFYGIGARAGDADAMARLGEIYLTGDGVPVNSSRGVELLENAANNGNAHAAVVLGDVYLLGSSVVADPARAVKYYEKGARLGSAESLLKLGQHYRGTAKNLTDMQTALAFFNAASNSGSETAKVKIGEAYLYGLGVGVDIEKARLIFQEMLGSKDPDVLSLIGDLNSKDIFVADGRLALDAYLRSASLRNPWGYIRAAEMLRDGQIVDADPLRSLEYFNAAARAGLVDARVELARSNVLMLFGRILSDQKGGLVDLEKLVEQGNVDATIALAEFNLWGVGVPQNPDHAAEILVPLSRSSPKAASLLISIYRDGAEGFDGRSLSRAEAILRANEKLFSPPMLQKERVLLDAAKASTIREFAEIVKGVQDIQPDRRAGVVAALRSANPNAFVYYAQIRMAERKLYAGKVSGQLSKPTIKALNVICQKGPISADCARGPLYFTNVQNLAIVLAGDRALQ